MKIWITKSTPYDYMFAGADRMLVHFDKPHYHPSRYVCEIVGAVDPHEFGTRLWKSNSSISLKTLRKTQSPLFLKIWKDIVSTYIWDQEQISKGEIELRMEFKRTYTKGGGLDYPFSINNEKINKLKSSLYWYMDEKANKYAESIIEKEGQSWREWIGEYEIKELELL